MASASDIRAGKAFVEIYVKNSSLMKGLDDAQRRLRDFGGGISMVGKWMMAAGTAGLAPLLASIARFTAVGDSLEHMAERTGMTVEALSQLRFAADQTDISLEDVEKGVRKMQKALSSAAAGGQEGQKALASLGLTIQDLAALNSDQQFDLIASKIKAIENPVAKAGAAMALFGKSGTVLLPMIGDLDEFKKKANELGLVMSTQNAAAAGALEQSLKQLKMVFLGLGGSVSASLVPSLTKFVQAVTRAGVQLKGLIRDNQDVVLVVVKVAATVAAAGAALIFFGGAITAVGTVVGMFHGFVMWAVGGIQLLTTGLLACLSPAGLLAAAIVGLGAAVVYFGRNTATIQAFQTSLIQAVDGVRQAVRTVTGDVILLWQGVSDAMAAGDIAAAVRVAGASMNIEWIRATSWMTETWQGFLSNVDLSISNLKTAWVEMSTLMSTCFVDAVGQWEMAIEKFLTSSLVQKLMKMAAMAPVAIMPDGMAENMGDMVDKAFEHRRQNVPQRLGEIQQGTDAWQKQIEEDHKASRARIGADRRDADDARAKNLQDAQKALTDALKERDAAVAAATAARKKAGDFAPLVAPKAGIPPLDITSAMKATKALVTFSAGTAAGAGLPSDKVAKGVEKLVKHAGQQVVLLGQIVKKKAALVMAD
jgi:hypothetical protein